MYLEGLPEELLLQIARHLPDSATPRHLKHLSLASRKLRPIAQEALFTTAKLTICCGCHPKVNALIKLLRTLLDRPDLAAKVRSLRFRAVRKRVEKLYAEQGFELLGFRDRCISKIEELGYHSSHPWWRSINNCVESAFGGLLLALLPNLTELDFWIKDHQHGSPSSECISGLWGGTSPPVRVLGGWKNVTNLVTGDTSLLKCDIDLGQLTTLDLRTVSIGTVLRLNGPGSLRGAESIKSLALTVSIQFADRPLVEKAEIAFSDLFEALNCCMLRNLKLSLMNDGYHFADDITTELSAGYFLDQLQFVEGTLHTLFVTLETTDHGGELDWLNDMFQQPVQSLKNFSSLKSLVIPQTFIYNGSVDVWSTDANCKPRDLPSNLERLELLWPDENVIGWAEEFNVRKISVATPEDIPERFSKFEKLVLTCRDDVGMSASYFSEGVAQLWCDISMLHGIETEVHDQLRGQTSNLADLYEEEAENYESSTSDEEDSSMYDEDLYGDAWEDKYVRDQTNVLACLMRSTDEGGVDGLLVQEMATNLVMDAQLVMNAVRLLRETGNVLAPSDAHLSSESRVRLIKVSRDLQSGQLANELLAEVLTESQTEIDCSSSDVGPSSHYKNRGEFPDPLPSAMSAVRIAILRMLRDLPDPSIGLTEDTLVVRLLKEPGNWTSSSVRKSIVDLQRAGFIRTDYGRSTANNRIQVYVKPSIELISDDCRKIDTATDARNLGAYNDDNWQDDNGTDVDMPDLEAFYPNSEITFGPTPPPRSRVGQVTETVLVRFIRQYGSSGVTHEEAASLLGISYEEVMLRAVRLEQQGHIHDNQDDDKLYFLSENAELLKEDGVEHLKTS